MFQRKSKGMQQHRICHCGKCVIKCNKHGKRATCADCGKRRMLGTIIEKGIMRHACKDCCIIIEERQRIDQEKEIAKSFKELRKINLKDGYHNEN